MRQAFIFILLTISQAVLAQEPKFANQDEQEKYWAKKVFDTGYVKQDIPRYKAKILVKGNTYYFGNQAVTLISLTEHSKLLFLNGILYPELIIGPCPDSIKQVDIFRCDTFRISNVEELSFLNHSFKQKRFRFLIWRQGLANPQLCFFELTNENATDSMPFAEFIKDAKLTFYKRGSILI